MFEVIEERIILKAGKGILFVHRVKDMLAVATQSACLLCRGDMDVYYRNYEDIYKSEFFVYDLKRKAIVLKDEFPNTNYDGSHCCGKVAVSNEDDNVYIYDLSGPTIEKKVIHVGENHEEGITLLENGFLASYNNIAYFDFNGNKRWVWPLYRVSTSPAVYGNYVYAPTYNSLSSGLHILKLSDGTLIGRIEYINEEPIRAKVCGHYLAVGTTHHIYLYDISNPIDPKQLWIISTEHDYITGCQYLMKRLEFDKYCNFLFYTVFTEPNIYVVDIKTGKRVAKIQVDGVPTAMSLIDDALYKRLYVGMCNGSVYEYVLLDRKLYNRLHPSISKVLEIEDRSGHIAERQQDVQFLL